jgi:hypothetical protein
MYCTPKHFAGYELVPPDVYAVRGEGVISLFRPEILIAADTIREHFGKPCTINNWKKGGQFSQRGLRTVQQGKAELSMHFFAGALDMDILGIPADIARKEIIKNQNNFSTITRIEVGVNWLHVDCANVNTQNGIVTFGKS